MWWRGSRVGLLVDEVVEHLESLARLVLRHEVTTSANGDEVNVWSFVLLSSKDIGTNNVSWITKEGTDNQGTGRWCYLRALTIKNNTVVKATRIVYDVVNTNDLCNSIYLCHFCLSHKTFGKVQMCPTRCAAWSDFEMSARFRNRAAAQTQTHRYNPPFL